MDNLTKKVAHRFSNVFPLRPKPKGPTISIGSKKYVLSDYFPMLGEIEDGLSGAKLIEGPSGPKFRYLWAYDTTKKVVNMWRVSDGDEKASGPARSFTSEILHLDRRGQLNRVTTEEMRTINTFMAQRYDDALEEMRKLIEENEDEWDRTAKRLVTELFNKEFLPKILANLRGVDQGLVPLGFKPNDRIPKSPQEQAKMYIAYQILSKFDLDAIEKYVESHGYDPSNPPGDIQALEWARHDVIEMFYKEHLP